MKLSKEKEQHSRLNPDALGLGEPEQDNKALRISMVIIALLMLLGIGFLGVQYGSRSAQDRIQALEAENELLRSRVEQYTTVVDSIYNMLDSLGMRPKEKRDFPYNSGGANEFSGYPRDQELKLRMENLEQKLSEILAFVEPKFPSEPMANLTALELKGDIPGIYPAFGRISDTWGSRVHPVTKSLDFHYGIDISNKTGTPIYATAAGIVKKASYIKGYGRRIVVDHGNGYESVYAHLYAYRTQVGEAVTKGQIIGLMGNSGLSTGPHLHYEVHFKQRRLNPANFLNRSEQYASR
jgi:murein DD-endopeptidase MepM/ murein hydrolase activator NlpD